MAAHGFPGTRTPRPSLIARLQATAFGRAVHGFLQWAVVGALICTGFVGAELIHSGIEMATRADVPATTQILAASSAGN
jgi:hypothetical protein